MGASQSAKNNKKIQRINSYSTPGSPPKEKQKEKQEEQPSQQQVKIGEKSRDIENPEPMEIKIDNKNDMSFQNQNLTKTTVVAQNQSLDSSKSNDSNLAISNEFPSEIPKFKQNTVHTPSFDDNIHCESIIIAEQNTQTITIFQEQHLPAQDVAVPFKGNRVVLKNQKMLKVYNQFGPYRAVDINFQIYQLQDGSYYVGQWLNKKRHGFGIHFTDKHLYEGYWFDDQFQGDGRIIYANGNYYRGEFFKGKYSGFGQYKLYNSDSYEGEWYDGLKNGMGKELSKDGSFFVGTFVNGMKEGQAKYYNNLDQSTMEGYWKNGSFQGDVTILWADGRKYQGKWKDGKMNGYGEFYWVGGKKYLGNYINNVREGYGEYYWIDGRVYKGLWKDGLMHGEGLLIYPNNSHQKGIWYKGRRNKDANEKRQEIRKTKMLLPQ